MSGSYRVVDPLNRLRLRVRLRLIQDVRLAARDNNKDSDHDATGRVYTYELRWQERVPGPRHALGERSLAPTNKKKKGKDDGDDDAKEQVLEHLKERQHRVFAYAAAEGYVLEEERSLVRDATGAAAPLVPHALAASRAPLPHARKAGFGKSTQRKKMTVADRRTGGDPGTCYYIMLGADVDLDAFEAAKKPEDATDDARGFEGVLCKLEHFTSGRLEVTPAFAGPDPRFVGMVFDGSDGGDANDDFYVGNGAPLLTSRIATPAGRVFEYVVENASAPTDEELVQLLEEELKEEVQRMEERRDRDPIIPPLVPPPPQCRGFGVSMELVSLVGFPPGVELYAEYEVHLPPGWRAETPRGDDHGRTWTENDEGGLCCAGTSQLARSVLRPCRAAHGSKRSAEDPSVARHARGPDAAEAVLAALGALLLVAALAAGPGYGVWPLAAGILVLASVGAAPSAQTSPHEACESVAHVGLPLDLYVVPPEDDCDAGDADGAAARPSLRVPRCYVAVFARRRFERHTVEGYGHFRLPAKPQPLSRERLQTWAPVGRIRDQLQDFFLGGAHRLKDLRYAAHPPDEWGAHPDRPPKDSGFLCKFGFMTRAAGCIDVRCGAVEARRRPAPVEVLSNDERRARYLGGRPAAARDRFAKLDAILADYRSRLKLGSDYSADDFDKDRDRSAADRAAELIRKLETERARQRADRAPPKARAAAAVARDEAPSRAPTLERGQLAAPRSPADPVVSVENPAGDTILDYSKPGGVEVTAGTVTRHRSGETVIDFSRTGARAAAPDLLTGDGAEESKAP